MTKHLLTLASAICLFFASCQGGGRTHLNSEDSQSIQDSLDYATDVTVEHATLFRVVNGSAYKELILLSPEATDTIARYALYRGERPQDLPVGAIPIGIPVQRIACSSTAQIGAIDLLGLGERIVAANSLNNVNSSAVRKRIDAGEIVEIARGISRHDEAILMANPEVLLLDYSASPAQDEELQKAGIALVSFNAWKERSLLGRAEWLKVAGLLLGRNQLADSLYQNIVSEYRNAQEIVANEPDTIQILYGSDYKGVWYVPGEYSYVTQMFRDAKIKYDYIPKKYESTPVNFEYVFSRHQHDKQWLSVMNGQGTTLKAFLEMNERYRSFDATKLGGVWLDRKRTNKYGGNDYWESGPYNPHLILKDLIKMTRPHLLPDYETTYLLHLR